MNEAIKLAIEYIENVPDDRQQVTHIDRDKLIEALRKPECRTCGHYCEGFGCDIWQKRPSGVCVNGDQYVEEPMEPLWKTK